MPITIDAFVDQLRTGRYQTPDGAFQWPGRCDAWYYLRMLLVICRGSWTARRGAWNDTYIVRLAFDGLRAAEACGATITVEGAPLLEATAGPVVVVANHMSMFETIAAPSLIGPFKSFDTVVKDSLMKVPLFGDIMRAAGSLAVTRRHPREDLRIVLEQGTARLRAGRSILIYPQSTRLALFQRERFGSIGVKLARRAGVPVVPLALRTDFQQNGRWIKDVGPLDRSRPIRFRFGAPIPVAGNGREAHEAVIAFITQTMREWGIPVT